MSRARMAAHEVGGLHELRHRLRHERRIAQVRIARQAVDLKQPRQIEQARDAIDVERVQIERRPSGTARPPAGRRPRFPGGRPRPGARLRTSSSMVLSRSSTSSSSISYSLLRVTRKTVACSSSMPGNSSGRCRRMTVSSGVKTWPLLGLGSGTKRGNTAGTCTTANSCSSCPRPLQQHRQVERLVQQVRERMAGVDGQRRQHREDFAPEDFAGDACGPPSRQVLQAAEDDALALQRRQHVVRQARGTARSTISRTIWLMRFELLRGGMRSAPEPTAMPAWHLLLQAADADHEELVEVGARRWPGT